MKEEVNLLIADALQEIFHAGRLVTTTSVGSMEDDIRLFMRAMQIKNKIYDFAVNIEYNSIVNMYEGKVAYSLINSTDNEYQDYVEFRF